MSVNSTIPRPTEIAAIACLLFFGAGSAVPADTQTIDRDMLPMAIIGYAFDLAYGEPSTSTTGQPTRLAEIRKSLEVALQGLGADVLTKLAFARETFVIEPDVAGSRFVGRAGAGSLFITTPIPRFDDRVVVILSSSGPESTTIFSMDSRVTPQLLYDSVIANRFANGKTCDPIGEITGVQISKAGIVTLHETNKRWSNEQSRTFMLDLRGANIELRCMK